MTRGKAAAAVASLLVLVALIGGSYFFTRSTEKDVTITVTRVDDQVKNTSNGVTHQYLIFTNDGVYKDVDSFWYLKFNSSDLFGQLQVGHTYACKSTGLRIPILSTYRNLISCHEAGAAS